METIQETRALSQIDVDVVVVGIFQDEDVRSILETLDAALPTDWLNDIEAECKREAFLGKSGQSLTLPSYGNIAARKLMLRGLGKQAEFNSSVVRKVSAVTRRAAKNCQSAALSLRTGSSAGQAQAVLEGWILGGYKFTKYKTKDDDKNQTIIKTLHLVASELDSKLFQQIALKGSIIAESTTFARDMIAEPAAYMTPTRLASVAEEVSKAPGVMLEVLDVKDAARLGMGAFLGVARGAKEPARFIILRYTHTDAKRTIGIAGKGITFDSGGLSIKSSQGMENMKYDMSGAAAVIATIKALAQMQVPINVTAVAAAAENMPGDNAMHPGDILTAMNGKTIEVNNTDAEGRLVLADALTYLANEKPDMIIDLATLTGAVVTALGRAAAGIMGNNDELIRKVIAAGSAAGEKYWQLPLFDEYKDTLKSDIADLKNAGARGEAPTSSAAMFLKEFVNGVPWVHLDIAGPAWLEKDKEELNKGGTAFGVRTLCYLLIADSSD